jgi:hypothetical protein
MKNKGNLVTGIAHGLIHPLIGIACLAPLDFQMQVFMGGNDIGRVRAASELLPSPCLSTEDSDPFLGHFPLGPSPFGTAVH